VHRYGGPGLHAAQEVDALRCIHRDRRGEHSGAAEVEDGHINVGEALVYGVEVVPSEGVTTDVHPEPRLSIDEVLEDASHHRGQHLAERTASMNRRHGDDPQLLVSFDQRVVLPRLQPGGREAVPAEPACGMRCRDKRRPSVQSVSGDAVPVITVQVRQNHGVERWKLSDAYGRLSEPARPKSTAEVGALPLVQEVGICQEREGAEPKHRSGSPYERKKVAAVLFASPGSIGGLFTRHGHHSPIPGFGGPNLTSGDSSSNLAHSS
jgi:hypothetical protein